MRVLRRTQYGTPAAQTKSDYIYGFAFFFVLWEKRDECNENEIQTKRNGENTLFAIELPSHRSLIFLGRQANFFISRWH